MTANFKLRKVRLREESFDIESISDLMYGLDNVDQRYAPLDSERVTALTSSKRR